MIARASHDLVPADRRSQRSAPRCSSWFSARLAATAVLLGATLQVRAQWQTQEILLKPGWSAVQLHVDASDLPLDTLIGSVATNPIQEVWMWEPIPSTAQFTRDPAVADTDPSQWREWNRSTAVPDDLTVLPGNAAFLVRNSSATNYTWRIKGRPVPPSYRWTTGGANFLGFSTPQSPASAPVWDNFLAPSGGLANQAEIFYYPGGEPTGASPTNKFLTTPATTPVTRGQAFWVKSKDTTLFNRYYGPFETVLQDPRGVVFGDSLGQYRLRLRNITSSARSVRLELINSEAPPSGVTPTTPSLLVRGPLDLGTLTYGFSTLNGSPLTTNLAPAGTPGSEIEIILGLDRTTLAGTVGTTNAALLRLTDATGLSQVDLPVSAVVASRAGLWVGAAAVTGVNANLKQFARATNATDLVETLIALGRVPGLNGTNYYRQPDSNLILVVPPAGGGYYLSTNVATGSGAVAQPFSLRLLVHHDGTASRLLQRVHIGLDPATNTILALRESQLHPGFLGQARRISAAHLPWSPTNTMWSLIGSFSYGGSLVVSNLAIAYDAHAANPFLHTYHPDHDNLDATFSSVLPVGDESYRIERTLRLGFAPVGTDFASRTAGGGRMDGAYLETMRLVGHAYSGAAGTTNETREIVTSGAFVLSRVSTITNVTATLP